MTGVQTCALPISCNQCKVGKRKTRVYYKLEPKGKEYLNQLYIDYMDINTSIIKIMEAGNE